MNKYTYDLDNIDVISHKYYDYFAKTNKVCYLITDKKTKKVNFLCISEKKNKYNY